MRNLLVVYLIQLLRSYLSGIGSMPVADLGVSYTLVSRVEHVSLLPRWTAEFHNDLVRIILVAKGNMTPLLIAYTRGPCFIFFFVAGEWRLSHHMLRLSNGSISMFQSHRIMKATAQRILENTRKNKLPKKQKNKSKKHAPPPQKKKQ